MCGTGDMWGTRDVWYTGCPSKCTALIAEEIRCEGLLLVIHCISMVFETLKAGHFRSTQYHASGPVTLSVSSGERERFAETWGELYPTGNSVFGSAIKL